MSKTGSQNMRLLGSVAAILVLVSLLLPWITTTFLGVSADMTGLEVFENASGNEQYYPLIAGVLAVVALVALQIPLSSTLRQALPLVLGLIIVICVFLLYNSMDEVSFGGVTFAKIELAYGAYLAAIGGVGVAVSGFLDR